MFRAFKVNQKYLKNTSNIIHFIYFEILFDNPNKKHYFYLVFVSIFSKTVNNQKHKVLRFDNITL